MLVVGLALTAVAAAASLRLVQGAVVPVFAAALSATVGLANEFVRAEIDLERGRS